MHSIRLHTGTDEPGLRVHTRGEAIVAKSSRPLRKLTLSPEPSTLFLEAEANVGGRAESIHFHVEGGEEGGGQLVVHKGEGSQ